MKEHELKFKYGDSVKLKLSDAPIMTVKDYELALTHEIRTAANELPTVNIPDQEPEYTGKVNVYWISHGERQTKLVSEDMLELVKPEKL